MISADPVTGRVHDPGPYAHVLLIFHNALDCFQVPATMFSFRISALYRPSRITKRGLATVARDAESFHIPVVNFARFKAAASPSEKKDTADEIVSAFRESGFVYLEGHGIPSGMFGPIHGSFS